ncbi:MAG: hypothetical protein KME31_32840 [Tolypothrix carrinoi HA7290-LM1]|nr:hypothetical protein [Tolypothrix carrinoi HA7290-LM1]
MGNGEWVMGNGKWALGIGQWAMGNGNVRIKSNLFPMPHDGRCFKRGSPDAAVPQVGKP